MKREIVDLIVVFGSKVGEFEMFYPSRPAREKGRGGIFFARSPRSGDGQLGGALPPAYGSFGSEKSEKCEAGFSVDGSCQCRRICRSGTSQGVSGRLWQ